MNVERVWGVLPWLVSAGVLAYVISSQDFAQIFSALRHANYAGFLGVLALFLAAMLWLDSLYLYAGTRWIAGVGEFRDLLRARAAVSLLVVVNFVAGLGGLAMYLKRRYGVPYAKGTAIMATELLQDVGAMGTITLFAAMLIPTAGVPAASARYIHAGRLIGGACVAVWIGGFVLAGRLRFLPTLPARHFLGLWGLKLVKCVVFLGFVLGALSCFDVRPPLLLSTALVQLALLAHGLPISAFGLGVDQITFPALLAPWAPADEPQRILAFSLVYTASLVCGRCLLGLPFVRGIARDLRS